MVADRLALLHDVADAVAEALRVQHDRGPSGLRDGQYALDLTADDAALAVLRRAGVGVLSEESGFEDRGTGEVVIIDPVDGSTNCARGVPWYSTALCLVDRDGPAVALVANQATGERWTAVRGQGAHVDGRPLRPSECTRTRDAILGLNGLPPEHLGWQQARVLGAVSLDLCLVAAGVLDGYVDCVTEAHGVWDHAASTLICREAGASIADLWSRDLVPLDHGARMTPIAGATAALLDELVTVRRRGHVPPAGVASGSAGPGSAAQPG